MVQSSSWLKWDASFRSIIWSCQQGWGCMIESSNRQRNFFWCRPNQWSSDWFSSICRSSRIGSRESCPSDRWCSPMVPFLRSYAEGLGVSGWPRICFWIIRSISRSTRIPFLPCIFSNSILRWSNGCTSIMGLIRCLRWSLRSSLRFGWSFGCKFAWFYRKNQSLRQSHSSWD